MIYSIQLLTTASDCDAAKQIVEKDKNNLVRRKQNAEAELETYSENSVNVPAEVQALETEIAGMDSIIAMLPAGKQKNSFVTRRKKLDARLSLLSEKVGNYGLVALIDRQTDVGKLEAQIDALLAVLDAIEAHRLTLG